MESICKRREVAISKSIEPGLVFQKHQRVSDGAGVVREESRVVCSVQGPSVVDR